MAMGKTLVLDRVAADLSRGLTHPAIQQLSSLVAAYPTDLDLRRRLAAVHRRVGNRIQAGRWDYLTIGADSTDTSAFERAFPSAVARLRAVRWPHQASAAATSYARSRLARLVEAAETETRVGREATAGGSGGGGGAAIDDRVGSRGPFATVAGSSLARLRSWAARLRSVPVLATLAAAAAMVVLGGVTVVEWIVQ